MSFILPGSGDISSTSFLCEKSLLFLRFRKINAPKARTPTTIPMTRTMVHACPFLLSVSSETSEDKPVKTYFMFIVTTKQRLTTLAIKKISFCGSLYHRVSCLKLVMDNFLSIWTYTIRGLSKLCFLKSFFKVVIFLKIISIFHQSKTIKSEYIKLILNMQI